HKCRRITKWKDNKDEGTITFITNDFETPADVLCEVYRRRWQIDSRIARRDPAHHFVYAALLISGMPRYTPWRAA
ncbi:MAG: hypothetical protein IJ083_13380, partial [Clostridia bacterium]|nr:hypothetical protein [Clostridia bacterium]